MLTLWIKTCKSDRSPSKAITLLNHVLCLRVCFGRHSYQLKPLRKTDVEHKAVSHAQSVESEADACATNLQKSAPKEFDKVSILRPIPFTRKNIEKPQSWDKV